MSEKTIEFLRLLGYLYLRHGQHDKAMRVLEALRVTRPRDRWVLRTFAYALLQAGRHARCLEQLESLPADQSPDLGVELMRSRALWALGRGDEARRVIRRLGGNLRGTDGERHD